MTTERDEILTAARDAGFLHYGKFPQDYKCKIEALYSIAFEAGRQAEREEIAELGEGYFYAESFRQAIRARGTGK